MFDTIPSEFQMLGMYFPPLFVIVMLGLMFAVTAAKLLNLTGLSRFFWHPPLAFAALWVLGAALGGLFLLRP